MVQLVNIWSVVSFHKGSLDIISSKYWKSSGLSDSKIVSSAYNKTKSCRYMFNSLSTFSERQDKHFTLFESKNSSRSFKYNENKNYVKKARITINYQRKVKLWLSWKHSTPTEIERGSILCAGVLSCRSRIYFIPISGATTFESLVFW